LDPHTLSTGTRYLFYFGLTAAAVRWWAMTDRRRKERFRLAPVIGAGVRGGVFLFLWPWEAAAAGLGGGPLVVPAGAGQGAGPGVGGGGGRGGGREGGGGEGGGANLPPAPFPGGEGVPWIRTMFDARPRAGFGRGSVSPLPSRGGGGGLGFCD